MARQKNIWCSACIATMTCTAVLTSETEMTKHWDVHCPGCNNKFEYVEVKVIPPPTRPRRSMRP